MDPWRLVERGFEPERIPLSESLFALSNGYLGVRGSLEETESTHAPGREQTFQNSPTICGV